MKKADVFFIELTEKSSINERVSAMDKLLDKIDVRSIITAYDKVAVKTHFGEQKNTTHISPKVIASVVSKVKEFDAYPFLTETSTLYSGPRQNAITHMELAYDHGFTYEAIGAPIIMCDGLLGNTEIEVEIPGTLYNRVNIARDVVQADALIAVSHPTGHMVTSVGACLKNLGMGLSSRKGKMQQHSNIKPSINEDRCTFCGQCITWCPEDAIIEKNGKAFIEIERCIGCGECLAVCNFNAVRYNFGVQSADIQQRIAEYALGTIINKGDKCLFINVLTDMTAQCDCMNVVQEPIIPDIGIVASFDPVAVDQATLDLTRQANDLDLGHLSHPELDPSTQINHAVSIGLGSDKYELKTIK